MPCSWIRFMSTSATCIHPPSTSPHFTCHLKQSFISLYPVLANGSPTSRSHAKQKHLGFKKGGANQKQHCKQAGVTKRFDIS